MDAKKLLEKRVFTVPESVDALLASFENPHVPEEDRLAREEDDLIQFADQEKAGESLSALLGEVPPWLAQNYKSKFPGKGKKEAPEAKEERIKKAQEESLARKRKLQNEAKAEGIETDEPSR